MAFKMKGYGYPGESPLEHDGDHGYLGSGKHLKDHMAAYDHSEKENKETTKQSVRGKTSKNKEQDKKYAFEDLKGDNKRMVGGAGVLSNIGIGPAGLNPKTLIKVGAKVIDYFSKS